MPEELQAVRVPDRAERVDALDALVDRAQAGDGSAVRALRALVADYRRFDPEIYCRTLNRWWLWGDATLEGPILDALADTGYGCQLWAADACGHFGFRAAVPALIGLLSHPDGLARTRVCQALGRLADPEAVASLAHVLYDPSEFVRPAAADALADIGGDRALGHLWSALEAHRSTRVGYLAAAIARFGPAVFDRLVQACHDPDPHMRFWIARALGCTGDPRAVAILTALVNDDPGVTAWGARVATAARTGMKTLGRMEARTG